MPGSDLSAARLRRRRQGLQFWRTSHFDTNRRFFGPSLAVVRVYCIDDPSLVCRGSLFLMNRRDFYRYGTIALGNLVSLALAVPGVAYLLDPLRRKSQQGDFAAITRLRQLAEGVPQAFPILDERQDAWVKYPREPVGSVWLIRQPAGSQEPVIAITAECPHLGCAVNLAPDGKSFLCPCHTSNFDFHGKPLNQVPPRPMDRLAVKLSDGDDPEILVRFQRFRTQSEEKIPLA